MTEHRAQIEREERALKAIIAQLNDAKAERGSLFLQIPRSMLTAKAEGLRRSEGT